MTKKTRKNTALKTNYHNFYFAVKKEVFKFYLHVKWNWSEQK